MWQKIPSYSGSNEIWGLGLIGQGRRTRPGSYRKYAYKLKRSYHVLQRGAILFWKIKKRKCFFYFFYFSCRESSSQTCGVTVGKHKDTNKTTARNKWAESGRKGGEGTPVHAARSLGCSLTWMSDMGCRLLRRDWRWAAVAPFLLLQHRSAIHSFLSSWNRCMPKTRFVQPGP